VAVEDGEGEFTNSMTIFVNQEIAIVNQDIASRDEISSPVAGLQSA
jgi:hypothetical protein